MNALVRRLPKYNLRTVLITVAVALLIANLVRVVVDTRQAMVSEIESKVARLEAARRQKGELARLSAERKRIETRAAEIEKQLFSGGGEEEVASAMQIRLQKMVTESGIESESIRPVPAALKPGEKEGILIPMVVKMRLTGTMPQFLDFMKRLYSDERLFKVEKMTIRPYKKAGLKIYLEIRGYYSFNPGCGDAGLAGGRG